MDGSEEGLLLIATTMIALIAFAVTVLAVMLIYRKRKLEHQSDIRSMMEKFERELLQTQLEVQKQTMHSIGREIHDNVGQKLTLAKIITQQLQPWDARSEEKIQTIASTVDESLASLRQLSTRLASDDADKSLEQLLQAECNRLKNAEVRVELSCQSDGDIQSPSIRSFVFRIVQEFLQNSLKHSECSCLGVQLYKTRTGELVVKAFDNGRGFVLENASGSPGNGLRNMKNRAAFLKASLQITSNATGTTMQLTVPAHKLKTP
ncbi:MAG TPA: histidine kinase [Chryseosolibacter sp.]